MESEFLTWGNFITWVICSALIYISLNFRLYMIFHHPGRKLKAKVKARRALSVQKHTPAPTSDDEQIWEGSCRPGSCPAR